MNEETQRKIDKTNMVQMSMILFSTKYKYDKNLVNNRIVLLCRSNLLSICWQFWKVISIAYSVTTRSNTLYFIKFNELISMLKIFNNARLLNNSLNISW